MDSRWYHLRDVAGDSVNLATAILTGSSSLFGWTYRVPFAGRWHLWKHSGGNRSLSCAISTTAANNLLALVLLTISS